MALTPTSIQAKAGRLFLLQLAGSTSPTSFTTVSGLRATDISINGNPVDISNKQSGGWREYLPGAGLSEMSFTGSGVFDAASQPTAQLLNAIFSSAANPNSPIFIQARIISGAGDAFVGTFAVATFKRSGAHDGPELYDITLNSSGPVIYETGPISGSS